MYAKTVTAHPYSSQKMSRIKIIFPSICKTDGFGSVTLQNRIPGQIHGTKNLDDLIKHEVALAVAKIIAHPGALFAYYLLGDPLVL
jgi:hypothetical protein